MIVPMKRLTLVGVREDEKKILRALQKAGAVELISWSDDEEASAHRPDEAAERIARFTESLSAIKPYAKKQGFFAPARVATLEGIQGDVEAAEEAQSRIRAILEERKQVEARLEQNEALYGSLAPWQELNTPLERLCDSKYTKVFVGMVEGAGEVALGENTLFCAEFYGPVGRRAALLMCHKEDSQQAAAFLKTIDWTDVTMPKLIGTPRQAMARLAEDSQEGRARLEALAQELEQCGGSASVLENASDALLIQQESQNAEAQVAAGAVVFRLEGWVRADEVEKVEQAIASATDAYYTEYRDPTEEETPPTVLQNDRFNTPFEFLIDLYSLPDPRGIDATPFMTPFYIALFGVMLSDTGYGLVLALGAWLLLKLKKPTGGMRGLVTVLFWGGISTMIWGVLVGSFFGLDYDVLFGTTNRFPLLIDPTANPVGMLLFCLLLGIIHLCAGHLIKMKMCFSAGDWQGAVFDNLSWVFILVGLVLAALPVAATFFEPPLSLGWFMALHLNSVGLGLALAGMAMILLFKGRDNKNPLSRLASGFGGLYGITSYVSDILSYARLLALGIATGYLAMVFNTLCSMLMGGSSIVAKVVGTLIAVVLLIVLHLFSVAINTLGSFVHCARLQYVEFFGKFYESGGQRFKPFSYKTKHVQLSK